jgi:transposase
VADAAAGFPAVADRLWLLLALTAERAVGTAHYRTGQDGAAAGGTPSQPSAALIDSQSVTTSEGGEARRVDVYKQTNGRKRPIVVAVLRLLLTVVVPSAGIPDGTRGQLVLAHLFTQLKCTVHNRWCRLKLIWADGAYEAIARYVRQQFGWRLEVVRRAPDAKGFVVLPRRWVVERSFGWLGRYRRLCRDFIILRRPVKQWSTLPVSVVPSDWSQRKTRIKKHSLSSTLSIHEG